LSLKNHGHKEVLKILTKYFDFDISRQKGSHIILRNSLNGRRVVVPAHDTIKLGTMQNILLQAGISEDEFLKYV
jgi:predicted RNA binding protein YcfA (HicA-like mRNA interferase family)